MLPDVFSPSELVSLILCFLVTFYVLYHMAKLRGRGYTLFVMALYCFNGSLVMTHLEEVVLPDLLNIFEHLLLAAGAFLVAFGCHEFLQARKRGEGPV